MIDWNKVEKFQEFLVQVEGQRPIPRKFSNRLLNFKTGKECICFYVPENLGWLLLPIEEFGKTWTAFEVVEND